MRGHGSCDPGKGGGQAMRLNRQGDGMRLRTSSSSMTDSEGRRVRVHGIAGCPWGFESALWVT